MKNTLWIFGDSFSCGGGGEGNGKLRTHRLDDGKNATPSHAWPMLVKEQLGLEEMYNWGNGGSAISYSQWQWNARKQHFVSGDVAIIVLTQPSRAWFCLKKPYITHIWNAFREFGIKEQSQPYVAELIANLIKFETVNMQVKAWFWQIQAESAMRGVKTVVIPCFHEAEFLIKDFVDDTVIPHDKSSLMFVKGNLHAVSSQEIGKDLIDLGINFTEDDLRTGHLCMVNHRILADAIVDSIENWKEINLTTLQWATGMVTVKNIMDDEFSGFFPISTYTKTRGWPDPQDVPKMYLEKLEIIRHRITKAIDKRK